MLHVTEVIPNKISKPQKLCFFSGRVSAYLAEENAYLVDGVAINGVSGGPAFHETGKIIGLVTAYIVNRATGEALPGVSLIRSVASLRDAFKDMGRQPTRASSDSKIEDRSSDSGKAPERGKE